MDKLLEELHSFPEREKNLRAITRYSLYKTMWYRSNLWSHSRRVAWITEEIVPIASEVLGSSFDPQKAIAIALVHDDAEILFGDIQAGNKAKMSQDELNDIKKLEKDAVQQLSLTYPQNLGTYNYKSLLLEAAEKSSLEAMIVNWADKYDAFGEALHEIYSGNTLWTKNVENKYGKISLPTEYYINYFNSFEKQFPSIAPLLLQKNSWLSIPDDPRIENILTLSKEHTLTSLHEKKGYIPYDQWVDITLRYGTEEDISNLYIKKEN